MFDSESSTASVAEGEIAAICITTSSDATVLGFDLTVTLTATNEKAIGMKIVFCVAK